MSRPTHYWRCHCLRGIPCTCCSPAPARSHRHQSATASTTVEENYALILWRGSNSKHAAACTIEENSTRTASSLFMPPRSVCIFVQDAAASCHLHSWCRKCEEDLLDASRRLNSVANRYRGPQRRTGSPSHALKTRLGAAHASVTSLQSFLACFSSMELRKPSSLHPMNFARFEHSKYYVKLASNHLDATELPPSLQCVMPGGYPCSIKTCCFGNSQEVCMPSLALHATYLRVGSRCKLTSPALR